MRITQQQAAAWGESSKMGAALTTLNTDLLDQIESEVISRISSNGIDTTSWVDAASTPSLVQTVIAKLYVSWLIDRQYSEDTDLNAYGQRLAVNAETLLVGIQTGAIDIPGSTTPSGQPSFYPNDASSVDDPAAFSMGMTF